MDTRANDNYRLVVLFLAYTGVRFGEMAALKVGRLDLDRSRARIAESVTPVQGQGMVWGTPKSHQRREVPMPRFLANELRTHIDGRDPGDLVFGGLRTDAPLRVSTFRGTFKAAAEAIGVPGLHPHDLRHTAASLAIASGADVKVVQQMLGHASATMTLDTYGHLFGDRLDEVAEAMEAARDAETNLQKHDEPSPAADTHEGPYNLVTGGRVAISLPDGGSGPRAMTLRSASPQVRGSFRFVHLIERYSNVTGVASLLERCLALEASTPVERARPAAKRLRDRLSAADYAAIVARHQAGEAIQGLAREYGVSNYSVRCILLGAGVKLGQRSWRPEDEAVVWDLHDLGLSIPKIVEATGVGRAAVRMILAKLPR